MKRTQKGITLVVLVLTIIILLILAGVTIAELTGDGLIKKALEAREENQKNTASEIMKLKITAAQMQSYVEKQEMATLEYLYNYLKNDDEIYSVETTSQALGDTGDTFAGIESIYARLAAYPSYEFGINSDLELASINGVKVATATENKIEELEAKVLALESTLGSFATKTELDETNAQLSNFATKSEIQSVSRTPLFTAGKKVSISTTRTTFTSNNIITLSDDYTNYKYLEINFTAGANGNGNWFNESIIIPTEKIVCNNSNNANWTNASIIKLLQSDMSFNSSAINGWFKNSTTFYIYEGYTNSNANFIYVDSIYGVK